MIYKAKCNVCKGTGYYYDPFLSECCFEKVYDVHNEDDGCLHARCSSCNEWSECAKCDTCEGEPIKEIKITSINLINFLKDAIHSGKKTNID